MPQPTATPTQNSDIAEAIEEAKSLEREKQGVLRRIGDNREYLRLMDRRGKLDEQQGEWLDAFYPLKARGQARDPEAVERTRKVKAEAR